MKALHGFVLGKFLPPHSGHVHLCEVASRMCERQELGATWIPVDPGRTAFPISGTQIRTDSRFNPAAGPARPAALLRETDFWAQGVSFGLEFRY